MAFYPYLLAAHVTAIVLLVGAMFAQNWLIAGLAAWPRERQGEMLAMLLRLDRDVTTPALFATWAFGIALAAAGGWFASAWLMAKLVLVVGLSALHGISSGRLRRFVRDGEPARAVPGVRMIIVVALLAIAVLAIAKPL